ncbi:MAG: DUF4440 domain-containing protein [Rhizobiaceae bacterium]|nr:DUF4440 domain-containing protein [Rhizobiaceae bacterium]
MTDIEHLKALEALLHQPEIRRDAAKAAALLADDFMEFGSSGKCLDKPAILAMLQAEGEREYAVESDGYMLFVISEDAALLTYRSFHRLPDGRAVRHVNRSSLWQEIEGNWRLRFHQGTPAG